MLTGVDKTPEQSLSSVAIHSGAFTLRQAIIPSISLLSRSPEFYLRLCGCFFEILAGKAQLFP